MEHVLIVLIILNGGPTTITQEFSSASRCQIALEKIVATAPQMSLAVANPIQFADCLPK